MRGGIGNTFSTLTLAAAVDICIAYNLLVHCEPVRHFLHQHYPPALEAFYASRDKFSGERKLGEVQRAEDREVWSKAEKLKENGKG